MVSIYVARETTTKVSTVEFLNEPSVGEGITYSFYSDYPNNTQLVIKNFIFRKIGAPVDIPVPYNQEQLINNFINAVNDYSIVNPTTGLVENYMQCVRYDDNKVVVTLKSGASFTSLSVKGLNIVFTSVDVPAFDYDKLDIYEDETIDLTSKLSDIEGLSNVFNDFSNDFTIPATDNNNAVFKHFYDINVDDDYSFNGNVRVLAYLEIDTLPLRTGTIQLKGVTKKSGIADFYKITFNGGLTQLAELFSDDKIDKLDYKKDEFSNLIKTWDSISKFNYAFNNQNFIDSLTNPTFKDGDLITPLIAITDRDWNYESDDSFDISKNIGAIDYTELRKALRVIRIIEAIEVKYNISFSRTFFGKAMFQDLFLWLNSKNTLNNTTRDIDLVNDNLQNIVNNDLNASNYFTYNFVDNYIQIDIPAKGVSTFATKYFFQINLDVIAVSNVNTKYKFRIKNWDTGEYIEDTNTVYMGEELSGVSNSVCWVGINPIEVPQVVRYSFDVEYDIPALFQLRTNCQVGKDPQGLPTYYANLINTNNTNDFSVSSNFNESLPDIKVVDFIQGLMKAFKLVIRPLTSNSFYVDNINNYYASGTTIDLTDFIDNTEVPIETPSIYSELIFKYQKTENVLGKKYRELKDPYLDIIGYGDLKANYPVLKDKKELKIELPFENMLFERVSNEAALAGTDGFTNILIGQSAKLTDNELSRNDSKPILFFNNGLSDISDTPIKVKLSDVITTLNRCYNVNTSNDMILSQVTDTLNFGSEVDPWHRAELFNSLYLNYWGKWIDNIYNKKQRKFKFKGNIPSRYIQELSLNDRILINGDGYRINDFKSNLNNNDVDLNLFVDISSPPAIPLVFDGGSFNANSYIIDYLEDGSKATLYGDFTTYNSDDVNSLIKIDTETVIDTNFSAGSGLNGVLSSWSDIKQKGDFNYILGAYTTYNGEIVNRIVKINKNTGAWDASFATGTGFNNYTTCLAFNTTDNAVFVGGLFSSYNGTTHNRLVKINEDGSVASGFVTGTGFNNTVTDCIVFTDGSLLVTGYFTQYKSVPVDGIVKLLPNGDIDTSFTVGTGLNAGVTTPDGILPYSDSKVYIYGASTLFNGVETKRLCRVNLDGTMDTTFNVGNGFDNKVGFAKIVLGDKILVQGDGGLTGYFTNFDGTTCKSAIINSDGSLYRAFVESGFIFNIGNYFYIIDYVTGKIRLLSDESTPLVNINRIVMNGGCKHYGIDVLKNEPYQIIKIDKGFGNDWVDILTESDDEAGEVVIKINTILTSATPTVDREMDLMFLFFSGAKTVVNIKQTGV